MTTGPSCKLCLLVACLMAAACRSSPPVRYYLLGTDVAAARAVAAPAEATIVVGPITFPDYLDRPQMVTRVGSGELVLSDLHRWAEPLERHFVSVLVENVALRLGSDRVFAFPRSSSRGADRRVKGAVTRFDVDETGRAELTVRWQVTDGEGAVLAPRRRSRYSQPAAAADHAARVEALAATVAAFSVDVVEALAADR